MLTVLLCDEALALIAAVSSQRSGEIKPKAGKSS